MIPLLLVACGSAGAEPPDADLGADLHRSLAPQARQVLHYLADLPNGPNGRVLSGQFIGYLTDAQQGFHEDVEQLCVDAGRWVAMIGVDFAYWSEEPPPFAATCQLLIDYWDHGGLVTMSWHATNPFTGGPAWDTSASGPLVELITPGTAAHAVWLDELDWLAAGLMELRDAGVVVLFRPFHEMNGDWFWWGGKDRTAFVNLWRHTLRRLTETHGLTNLLWVFAPNAVVGSWLAPAGHYYPGDDYVDVVGLDFFGDGLNLRGYDELTALDKPFGITEFGPAGPQGDDPDGTFDYMRLINAIRERYPLVTFFQAWSDPWSLQANQGAGALLADPWIITREELLISETGHSE